jgi:Flp pilus assembly protein TadB
MACAGENPARTALAIAIEKRLRRIRARLPFVIDAMGLAIECGPSVYEGMAASIGGRDQNDVQQEISHVIADIGRGRSLADALTTFKSRMRDPMVDEFVNSTTSSHQLGCGISKLLLSMAQRMRQRRSHEIETAAGRAQIKLYYPGLLLMLVCMVVVVAPFFAPMTKILKGFMP